MLIFPTNRSDSLEESVPTAGRRMGGVWERQLCLTALMVSLQILTSENKAAGSCSFATPKNLKGYLNTFCRIIL